MSFIEVEQTKTGLNSPSPERQARSHGRSLPVG